MPSPQKQKGSSFEREIAQYLSKVYNESFIRAPGSGAYVGGKNKVRTQILHEGQIRSFKGDIVPGQSFPKFNAECKSYADFPFNLVLAGNCKVLDGWLDQMMDVSEKDDINILFMKFNRKGKFVVVQTHLTWVTDIFLYYTSTKHKDWLIIDFDHFFKHNTELLKLYSQSNSSFSPNTLSPNLNSQSNSSFSPIINIPTTLSQ